MSNYLIIIFKNKVKKKVVKGYATEENATKKYKILIEKNKVQFEIQHENAEDCKFEIALLSKKEKIQPSLFKVDDMGRNNKVFLDGESDYIIKSITDYMIEERIYDWQLKRRISFDMLLDEYCGNSELKSISTLNNKLVIQSDENFYLFSLKNINDCQRLLKTMENHFIDNGRLDAFFVRDISSAQRKWLYEVLVKKGYNKRLLYREKTTFAKRT